MHYFLNVTNVSIVNCHFIGNHITGNLGGGALYVSHSHSVNIRNSSFVKTMRIFRFINVVVLRFFRTNFILIYQTLFKNNTATSGGAIFAVQTDLTLHQSSFLQNNATTSGGAVDTLNSSIVISESEFKRNMAISASVIYAINSTISILNSFFFNNTAVSTGGIVAQGGSVVRSNNSVYSNNSALVSAVYLLLKTSCFFVNNTFVNNQMGGVIHATICSFISIDDAFINNSKVLSMISCNCSLIRNQFINNVAANSYCMTLQFGSLFISETTYVGKFTNGAISVTDASTVFIADSSYRLHSTKIKGGGIYVVGNVNLTVLRSNFLITRQGLEEGL